MLTVFGIVKTKAIQHATGIDKRTKGVLSPLKKIDQVERADQDIPGTLVRSNEYS